MTIARDKRDGRILGQVTELRDAHEREQDWLASQGRLTRMVSLLTASGYVRIPAHTVTLEKVS